jgi:predicted metalloendopeptidase
MGENVWTKVWWKLSNRKIKMEEKNNMKVVKGGKAAPEVRKLSYEELENTAHQLSEQSRQLYMQNQKLNQALQEANLTNFYERLKWLWTVITSTTPYISEEFKQKCGAEFEVLMTQPEQEPEEEVKEGE